MSLKIGIVGAGVMLKYHADGFRSAGAELTCLADTSSAAAHAAASTYGIPMIFSTFEEMLAQASGEIDAVSVLTPPVSHKMLAIRALQAGKHVFCEKPPAMNASEVLEMKRTAEQCGRHLLFDFNNRIRPESLEIVHRIKSGVFGRINSAQAVWVRRSGIPRLGSWFTSRQTAGGGALMDLLHVIDLALHFMSYPQPSYVLAQTFNDFMDDPARRGSYGVASGDEVADVESAAHGFVTFESGQVLSFRCSWAEMVREEQCSVTFQGQKGGGKVARLFQEYRGDTIVGTCEIYSQEEGKPANQSPAVPFDGTMGRVASAINFVRVIKGKAEPLATPLEAYRLMRIVDAIYRSAKSGAPVQIE